MSGGPTWNSWFSFPVFAPLSGAVSQDITTAPYQGVPEIELAVIREAGSFGRQLGILSEAVKELAERMNVMPAALSGEDQAALAKAGGKPTPLQNLAELIAQVDAVKGAYEEAVARDAAQALARLHRTDPDASKKLIDLFRE